MNRVADSRRATSLGGDDAAGEQAVRDAIGQSVELTVGQALARPGDGDPVRVQCRLNLEPVGDRSGEVGGGKWPEATAGAKDCGRAGTRVVGIDIGHWIECRPPLARFARLAHRPPPRATRALE